MPSPTEIALAVLFALSASAFLLPRVYSLLSFVHLYFIHRSTLRSYVHSPRSFALVTGASDGIGRALALELARLGFNLILHGRNSDKLERVKEEVLQRSGAGKEVRLWVQDASAREVDWEGVRKMWAAVEITVLVNNVGGTVMGNKPFDNQPLSYVDSIVQLNTMWPFHLTHTLLPQLRALDRPTLVLTTGSLAGQIPLPHFAAYAASKAFLDCFVHALEVDERLVLKSKVKFHYLQTGTVMNSTGIVQRTSFAVPSTEAYARGVVPVVGAKRRKVFPWMPHALQAAAVQSLGEDLTDRIVVNMTQNFTNES
ncbi:NAD(P)-binding protein [Calocera cornea HHB12733]|uniref:NAD(P)-binding protein n=1 Tax=Calocera cornea HHB12733 TaxID=1353952 RepID=A0A165EEG8_9BASI|nr:NAD(P)-binding protein [Calocera cornea HHB12733]